VRPSLLKEKRVHDGIDGFIIKPKGMRWRTFHRLMAKVQAAEDIVEHIQRCSSRLSGGGQENDWTCELPISPLSFGKQSKEIKPWMLPCPDLVSA